MGKQDDKKIKKDSSQDEETKGPHSAEASRGEQRDIETEDIQEEEVVAKVDLKKIEELENKVEELEGKYRRAVADYQNLEKWMREQRGEWIRSANKELLLRMLPVFDTLDLASKHSEDQSLKVTVGQFLDVLKSEGVTKIDCKNKEFDPVTMECVVTEPGEENKVLEELRSGFMLNDKVLRPAQVKVGQGK